MAQKPGKYRKKLESINHAAASCGGSEVRIVVAREFVMRTSDPKPH
jgi:hypothetical protein